MLEQIMGSLILIIAFTGMILSCSMRNSSESDRLVVAGVLANSILVVYYTSPLSTMFEVFRTTDFKVDAFSARALQLSERSVLDVLRYRVERLVDRSS